MKDMKSSRSSLHLWRFRLAIVNTETFRDWEVARLLCQWLDQEFAQLDDVEVGILLVERWKPGTTARLEFVLRQNTSCHWMSLPAAAQFGTPTRDGGWAYA